MKQIIKKGVTSKRLAISILDSSKSDGSGLAGLTSASGGLTWTYWREDHGNVAGTAITLAAGTRGAYVNSGAAGTGGGFIEKDATLMPGDYEISVPDACLAAGASWVVMRLQGATNMAPVRIEITLVDNTVADAIALLPAALVGGRMDSSVGAMASGVITESAVSTPAEASGRPTGLLAMMRRIFEWHANKRTRDRSTGTVLLRNSADSATLETQTQSTLGTTDTQTQGS